MRKTRKRERDMRINNAIVLILGIAVIVTVILATVFLFTDYPSYLREQDFLTRNAFLYGFFLNRSNWAVFTSTWSCGGVNITVAFFEPAFNGLLFNRSSGVSYNNNKTCVRLG